MTAKNDITGVSLRSKPPTQKYSDGWERIFGDKKSDKKKKNKSDPKTT